MQKKADRRCQICREDARVPGRAYCDLCRKVLEDIQRAEGRRSKYHLTPEQKAYREQRVQEQIQRIELEQRKSLSLTRREGPTPWVLTYPDGKKEFFITLEAAREAITTFRKNECLKHSSSPPA